MKTRAELGDGGLVKWPLSLMRNEQIICAAAGPWSPIAAGELLLSYSNLASLGCRDVGGLGPQAAAGQFERPRGPRRPGGPWVGWLGGTTRWVMPWLGRRGVGFESVQPWCTWRGSKSNELLHGSGRALLGLRGATQSTQYGGAVVRGGTWRICPGRYHLRRIRVFWGQVGSAPVGHAVHP